MSVNVSLFDASTQGTANPLIDVPAFVRASGRISVDARFLNAATRASRVSEEGSLRVRFPREEGEELSCVAINTGGGVTGGDKMSVEINAGPSAKLAFTSAAAEKIYRSAGACAEIKTHLTAQAGAILAFLPQETIIYNGARVRRFVDVHLDGAASALLCDLNCIGRTQMNENVDRLYLHDRWRISIGSVLDFADTTKLDGDATTLLRHPAIAGGASCFGTLIAASPQNADIERKWRAIAEQINGRLVLATGRVGHILVTRMIAQEMVYMREAATRLIEAAGLVSLPRSWAT